MEKQKVASDSEHTAKKWRVSLSRFSPSSDQRSPAAHRSPGSQYQIYRRQNDVALRGTKFISVQGSIVRGGGGGGVCRDCATAHGNTTVAVPRRSAESKFEINWYSRLKVADLQDLIRATLCLLIDSQSWLFFSLRCADIQHTPHTHLQTVAAGAAALREESRSRKQCWDAATVVVVYLSLNIVHTN